MNEKSAEETVETEPQHWNAVHMYVVCPSQWGQQACYKLLDIARSQILRVTLIVPRVDEKAFQKWEPAIDVWRQQQFNSVKDACEKLRIEYVYDDFLDVVRAQMLRERSDGDGVIVYVTSNADKHIEYAKYFNGYASRILIEKPYSAFYEDLQTSEELQTRILRPRPGTEIVTAEHYLFRPGVTAAWTEPKHDRSLRYLLKDLAKAGSPIKYEFRFDEKDDRDPNDRPNAYKDGSIVDIAVVHGLGPICRLLLPALGLDKDEDAAPALGTKWTWTGIAPYAATDGEGELSVATLAETAVELAATLELDHGDNCRTQIDISLRSAKGAANSHRYFRFGAADNDKVYCQVSLGAPGYEICPENGEPYKRGGGGDADASHAEPTGAADAQAAMLHELLEPELSDRFMPLELTRTVLDLAIKAQSRAAFLVKEGYQWGQGLPTDIELRRVEEPHAQIDAKGKTPYEIAEQLLGLRQGSAAAFRFMSFLGDEGDGHGDIGRALSHGSRKMNRPCRLVRIPRDESWASRGAPKSRRRTFSLDIVLQEFAQDRIQPDGGSPRLLILDGVDRLSPDDWKLLVHALNKLPGMYRVCLLSNRSTRTAGAVVRTQRVIKGWDPTEKEAWPSQHGGNIHNVRWWWRRRRRRRASALTSWIKDMAGGNITLRRQLRAYLGHVMRSVPDGQDPHQLAEDHLAALELPRPVATNPVALLERVSRLLLVELSPEELAAVRTLALLNNPDETQIEAIFDPGDDTLRLALFQLQGNDNRMKLFPRVRHVALAAATEELEAERRRRDRRLLMRSLHRQMDGRVEAARDLLSLLGSADLSTLSFRNRAFGRVAHDIRKALADARDGSGTELILQYIDMLIAERGTTTNLNLKSRAELSSLSGIMMFDRDDGSSAAVARLHTGYEIARYHHLEAKPKDPKWASVFLSTGAHLLLMHLHLENFWEPLLCGEAASRTHGNVAEGADSVAGLLEAALEKPETKAIATERGEVVDAAGNLGRASRALSLYHGWRGDIVRALGYAETAMEWYEKSNDHVRVCRSYLETGLLNRMRREEPINWPTSTARGLFRDAKGKTDGVIDFYLRLLVVANKRRPNVNVDDMKKELEEIRMGLEHTGQSVFVSVVDALGIKLFSDPPLVEVDRHHPRTDISETPRIPRGEKEAQ